MASRLALLLAIAVTTVVAIPSLTKYDEINNSQDSWIAGHNEISDKSFEYKKRLCGVLTSEPEDRLPEKELEIMDGLPATFDARSQWPHCPSINSIKNQGNCGSCWAVGAASSVSDRLCIATNSRVKLNISIENLMTCCSECVVTGGCDGGYPDKAWAYIQSTGLVTGGDYESNEGCQPYQISPTLEPDDTPPCSKHCTNKKYGRSYNKDLHFDKNAYTLPSKNVLAMQTEILRYGPVEATFDVYDDFFDYVSGVYVHTSEVLAGRHAVRVLGWGRESGKNYWLVANSWGRNWGINGLFKILRGTNECNFEAAVSAGRIKF